MNEYVAVFLMRPGPLGRGKQVYLGIACPKHHRILWQSQTELAQEPNALDTREKQAIFGQEHVPGEWPFLWFCKFHDFRSYGNSRNSMLTRLPLPRCFCPRGRKLRPWSEKNSDQNSDHPRLCIYWGKEKLRPWSEFLGRENSDHGLSFGCFWGRGRRGGSQ